MVSVEALNACFSKKVPNKVGASIQPCFTPLDILKVSEYESPYCLILFISAGNDWTIFRSLGGQPILLSILNKPSLFTRLSAFVKLMKSVGSGCVCSCHCSFCCRRENITSIMEHSNLKPHWDLRYTLSASFYSLPRTTQAKTFLLMFSREIPL